MNVDVEIDLRHALLWRLVGTALVPAAISCAGISDIGEFQASPLRQLAAAFPAELPRQHCLLAAFVGADDVRTQFAIAAVVGARHLLLGKDRVTEEDVGGAGHYV